MVWCWLGHLSVSGKDRRIDVRPEISNNFFRWRAKNKAISWSVLRPKRVQQIHLSLFPYRQLSLMEANITRTEIDS